MPTKNINRENRPNDPVLRFYKKLVLLHVADETAEGDIVIKEELVALQVVSWTPGPGSSGERETGSLA